MFHTLFRSSVNVIKHSFRVKGRENESPAIPPLTSRGHLLPISLHGDHYTDWTQCSIGEQGKLCDCVWPNFNTVEYRQSLRVLFISRDLIKNIYITVQDNISADTAGMCDVPE